MVPQPRCTLYSVALLKGRIVPMEFPAFCRCVRSACFLRRAHTHRQPKARHETSIPSTHGHFIPTETNSTLKSTPNYLHRRFYHPVSLSWHFGAADSGSDTRFCLHLPSASVVAHLSLICEPSLDTFYFYCIVITIKINVFLSSTLIYVSGASGRLSDWHLFDLIFLYQKLPSL
jgi:hypothetical protein